jgi:succinoglycan biosynthesis protein ExoA
MQISVIVPVRNEGPSIRRTLECLLRQDFERSGFEVIVVDGESEDDTVAIVRQLQSQFSNLHLRSNPKRLASAARNIGIRQARGQFIVIVDGHCAIHDPHYLTNLVEAFERSGADCLGRPQPLRTEGATRFQQAVALARESWLGHNPDSDNFANRERFVAPDNVAVAYRREVFAKVGLFDESFDACEDVEFNTRVREAGLTCFFTPAIQVDYQPRATVAGLFRQMFRYGWGRSRLGRKHRSAITLPSLVPVLWLIWLPIGIAISLFSNLFAVLFGLSIAMYVLAIFGESLRLSWKRSFRFVSRVPLIFFVIHFGFAWGFLRERLVVRRR